jgi:biotin operon repressor
MSRYKHLKGQGAQGAFITAMTTAGQRPQLTERQREILNYIEREVRTTGVPPCIRQIGEALGISSTNGVRAHLQALVKEGLYSSEFTYLTGYRLARPSAAPGLQNAARPWLKSPFLAVSQQANRFSQ